MAGREGGMTPNGSGRHRAHCVYTLRGPLGDAGARDFKE